MGFLTNPKDSVGKLVTLPRWERDWIGAHKSINFSGLCQEIVCQIIKDNDPEYYEQNKKYLNQKVVRQKDTILRIVSQIKQTS